jgi:hypothetical protein
VIDLAFLVLIVLFAAALMDLLIRFARRWATANRRRAAGGPRGKPRYDFEPSLDRLSRKVKGVQGPPEDRPGMTAFIMAQQGVAAYVEPRTVIHPLSVVLIAADGAWRRFELADDSFLRQLAREHQVPVFDAARTGYPEHMRKHRSGPPPPEE